MSNHEEFYDNPDVRAKYAVRRTQPDNPNDTLERPIFLELVGNLNQLDIIDLCSALKLPQSLIRSYERMRL